MSMTYWGSHVSANDLNAAVVLLANPGLACDKLRQAVVNAGGRIVLETAPAQAEVSQVLDAAPAAVVIALDASTDHALDVLEPLLDQAGVMVLLEEAELAEKREGWDAQRWERHLAAKLQGHANVLPPGAEEESTLQQQLQPGMPPSPAMQHAGASIDAHIEQAVTMAPAVPADGLDYGSDFDTALLSAALDTVDVTTGQDPLQDLPSFASAPAAQPLGEEPAANAFNAFDSFDYDFQAQAATPGADAEVAQPLDALLAGAINESTVARASVADAAAVVKPAVVPPPLPPPLPEIPVAGGMEAADARSGQAASSSLSQWSLVDFDGEATAAPAVEPVAASVAPARQWDLSKLSLMDLDSPVDAVPANQSVRSVALVIAGIGGPDAIRRMLAELPAEGMPGSVLIQLRLDGGRYANLVAQLSRVCAAPVELAEAGKPLQAGHVYVIDEQVTLAGSDALHFDRLAPMASILADLPAAGGAVIMLSGADATQVDSVLALGAQGAWVAGQSGEGCYDPAAASALAVAGMPIGEPAWLARELLARWGL